MESGVSLMVVAAATLILMFSVGSLLVFVGVAVLWVRRSASAAAPVATRPAAEPALAEEPWQADSAMEEPTGEHTVVVSGFGQDVDGDAEHTELISDDEIQALLHGVDSSRT